MQADFHILLLIECLWQHFSPPGATWKLADAATVSNLHSKYYTGGSLAHHRTALLLTARIQNPHRNFLGGCTKISDNGTHEGAILWSICCLSFHKSLRLEATSHKKSLPNSDMVYVLLAASSPSCIFWNPTLFVLKEQEAAWAVRKTLQNAVHIHALSSFSEK